MRPSLSVIIPTHNRANLLVRAVESVLAQSFEDFELLVVDDASSDDTHLRVESISDPRFVYLRQKEKRGAPTVRNVGIRAARSELVAFLDDDDYYHPDFLKKTKKAFEQSLESVGFSWSGARWVRPTDNGEVVIREGAWQPEYENREKAYRSFLRSRHIGTACGVCFRKSALVKVGLFDERLVGGAEDTDLYIRLAREFDFIVLPETLVTINLHSGTHLRHHSLAKARDYELIMQKNEDTLRKEPDTWAALLYKTAWLFYSAGDRANGRRNLWRSLSLRPLQPKVWAACALYEVLGRRGASLHRKISGLRH